MAIVLNVFCCGTGEHHNNHGNIVPEAYRAVTGSGGTAFIIDGVGQKTHRVYKNKKEFKRWNRGGDDYVVQKKHKNSANSLVGYGVYDNIRNGLMWIHDNLDAHTETVNLVGWSRGAVECILLAHSIHKAWPELKINIFAIDPVAGGFGKFLKPFVASKGNFEKTGVTGDHHKLPPGVSEYYGVVAEQITGASKKMFFGSIRPRQDSSIHGQYWRHEIHMPGDHSGVAKITGPIGEIVASECGWFLARNGVENSGLRKMGQQRTLEKYADIRLNFMKQNANNYTVHHNNKMRDKKNNFHDAKVPMSVVGYARNRKNEDNRYLKHSFFINNHHAKLLRDLLGDAIWITIDNEWQLDSEDRAKVRNSYPRTRLALKQAGLWRE